MAAREAAAKKRAVAPASEPVSLLDPKTQESILSPEGIEFDLFGDQVRIYPLAMKYALKFNGLVVKILGASSEFRGDNTVVRIGGALAERYNEDFLPHLARALHRPDENPTQEQIAAIVAEIEAKMNAKALLVFAGALLIMVSQNQSLEALGIAPEQQAKN